MNIVPPKSESPWPDVSAMFSEPQSGPPSGPRRAQSLKYAVAAAVCMTVIGSVMESAYTVQPTEMAGVRRLGTVMTAEPVGPGLHFKLPWMDTVDTIQTSLDTLQMNNLTVYTVDNQAVSVGVGVSFHIPPSAVMHLLYGVGRSGNVDIAENIRPILADRILRVFSTQNTVGISANRQVIADQIRKEVSTALGSIFGLEITDLQLSSITYSPSFQASVEAAVQAKNDSIRAENTVAKVRYEGEQSKVQADALASIRIAQANAEAAASVVQARAQRESSILRAEGDAQALALTGDAQAKVIQMVGVAVAANPSVVSYEASHRWDGQLPSTMLSGASTPLSMFNIQPGTRSAATSAPGEQQARASQP